MNDDWIPIESQIPTRGRLVRLKVAPSFQGPGMRIVCGSYQGPGLREPEFDVILGNIRHAFFSDISDCAAHTPRITHWKEFDE